MHHQHYLLTILVLSVCGSVFNVSPTYQMSRILRKLEYHIIGENKGADQLISAFFFATWIV